MSNGILGLLNPGIAIIFATIFAGLWVRNRASRHVLAFAASYFCIAVGFLTFHYTSNPDGVASILFMHIAYSVAVICVSWGATRRANQALSIPVLALICAIGGVMMVLSTYGADMNARLFAANASYGLVVALAAQALFKSGHQAPIDRAIGVLFVITAIQFFVRPQMAMITQGPMTSESYRGSTYYAVLVLIIGLVSLLLALTLVTAVVIDQWRSVREEAKIDHLSGIKMRGAYENEAMGLLDGNHFGDRAVSMIVADIDHFKRVNDVWGHQAGDQVIARFGTLVLQTVREKDLCGRIGGEEFAILVQDCNLEQATGLAERLRKAFGAIEHPDLIPGTNLTASFGVAQWRYGEGYGKLFARADAALYRAKDAGRNKVLNEDTSRAIADTLPIDRRPSQASEAA